MFHTIGNRFQKGLKTLCEKEKMLITSIFPFPPQCFQKSPSLGVFKSQNWLVKIEPFPKHVCSRSPLKTVGLKEKFLITNNFSFSQSCLLFQLWLYGKAASGLERILCVVLDKKMVHWPPQYNWNTVGNGVKHHTTNQPTFSQIIFYPFRKLSTIIISKNYCRLIL